MPYVTATDAGPLHLDYELTRAKFQDLTSDLLTRTRKPRGGDQGRRTPRARSTMSCLSAARPVCRPSPTWSRR